MNKTRLVTFTPTDAFFFGGETTFGNGDHKNFYAASNVFPQQTTLVGVLRHALHEAGYTDKIGNSFVVGMPPDFGDLEKLSPVFIYHAAEMTNTFALPVQLPNTEKKTIPIALSLQPKMQVNLDNGWQTAPVVADYKEKYGMESLLLFSAGATPLKPYQTVFKEVTKTGIARDRKKHTTQEGMFYQQKLFKLNKGYAFGAFVTGTDTLFSVLEKRNMTMGGEKMNFVLEVHDDSKNFEQLFYQAYLTNCMQSDLDWVLLTSDAYVDATIYELCHLAISDTRSFRNIITPNSEYYSVELVSKKDGNKRYKSEKFTLLKRGTVLFPKREVSEIITKLTNQAFQKIGYNHYFTNQKTANYA